MPPKSGKQSDKSAQKKKEKIAEDKTFGLKNKNKSKKVQNYVQQVKKVVLSGGKTARQLELEKQEREAKKAAKKGALDDEMAQLFRAVVEKPKQEVRPDVDPKSQLCAYFKAGQCNRGNKCKYSHDLNIERKVDKINLYQDPREIDTMEQWDQKKLEEVVASKTKGPPPSNIICKYFLDAIEQQKYGWFWECPNGETCHYKHALPPGYVFKPKEEKKREKEEEDDGPTLEERIEMQRAKLDISKCTAVTLESFTKWKEVQAKKKADEIEQKREAAAKAKGSKGYDVLSGRALFTYDPSLFVDDDDAVDDDAYEIVEAKSDDENSDDEKNQAGGDNAGHGDASGDEDGNDDDNNGGDDEEDDDSGNKPAADVAAVQDASLFLAEDVELPDDDDN